MPVCVLLSQVRTDGLLFFFSGSVIGWSYIVDLSFSITILDVIYLRTRFMLYIFFFPGRNSTRSTHLYLQLYIETFISSPFLLSLQWTAFLFVLDLWFGSLVLGLVEGFDGMEDGSSYPTLSPSDIRRVI